MTMSIARRLRAAAARALPVAALAALSISASPAPALAVEAKEAVTPFLPIAAEAAPRLSVDAPLTGPLADRGTAIIPYQLENFRIVPVFGPTATDVSPRIGHLHVTVDDLPWHWADASSTDAVVVAGLAPGPHNVLIEIATPDHRVIAGQKVHFVVPPKPAGYGLNH